MSLASGAMTALNYCSPARSPVFAVAVAGSLSLLMTAELDDKLFDQGSLVYGFGNDHFIWLLIAVPVYAALACTIPLALVTGRGEAGADEDLSEDLAERRQQRVERTTEQWKQRSETTNFARALGAASPLVALVFAVRAMAPERPDLYFVVLYGACLLQVGVFVAFLFARVSATARQTNVIQLSLLTSCFLVAASIATTSASQIEGMLKGDPQAAGPAGPELEEAMRLTELKDTFEAEKAAMEAELAELEANSPEKTAGDEYHSPFDIPGYDEWLAAAASLEDRIAQKSNELEELEYHLTSLPGVPGDLAGDGGFATNASSSVNRQNWLMAGFFLLWGLCMLGWCGRAVVAMANRAGIGDAAPAHVEQRGEAEDVDAYRRAA